MWYRRHECGFRMAIFFSAATAAGAFGGLLARGILEMKGVGGYNGWRWLFILEGILTFIIGMLTRPAFLRGALSDNFSQPSLPSSPCTITPRPPNSSSLRSVKRSPPVSSAIVLPLPMSSTSSISLQPSRTGRSGSTCSSPLAFTLACTHTRSSCPPSSTASVPLALSRVSF